MGALVGVQVCTPPGLPEPRADAFALVGFAAIGHVI